MAAPLACLPKDKEPLARAARRTIHVLSRGGRHLANFLLRPIPNHTEHRLGGDSSMTVTEIRKIARTLGIKTGKGFYSYPDAPWMRPEFLIYDQD